MQIFVGSNDHFLRENFTEGLLYLHYDIRYTSYGKFAEKLDDFDTLFDTLFYIT